MVKRRGRCRRLRETYRNEDGKGGEPRDDRERNDEGG